MCGGGMIPDIMHDILEGVLQLEFKLLLHHLKDDIFISYINDTLKE
jgi:hypothetical protein